MDREQTSIPSLMDALNDDRPVRHRRGGQKPSQEEQDRLVDSKEADRGLSSKQMQDILVRDLQLLLNARQPFLIGDLSSKEIEKSLYSYGLPDMTAVNPRSHRDTQFLKHTLETTIRRFEPRLSRVKIELIENQQDTNAVKFRIHGYMRLRPHPIAISFDTLLQANTKIFSVKES